MLPRYSKFFLVKPTQLNSVKLPITNFKRNFDESAIRGLQKDLMKLSAIIGVGIFGLGALSGKLMFGSKSKDEKEANSNSFPVSVDKQRNNPSLKK